MVYTHRTVNAQGLAEIQEFLYANHKQGKASQDGLHAWAADAEFQMGEGNPPCIELKAHESNSGRVIEFEISPAGIDTRVIHDDE